MTDTYTTKSGLVFNLKVIEGQHEKFTGSRGMGVLTTCYTAPTKRKLFARLEEAKR